MANPIAVSMEEIVIPRSLNRVRIFSANEVLLSKTSQALHGLAPKCKLINIHELINKSTNDYVTLLPCENGANVNNKG